MIRVFMTCLILVLVGAASFSVYAADDVAAKQAVVAKFLAKKPSKGYVDNAIENIAEKRFAPTSPAKLEFITKMKSGIDYQKVDTIVSSALVETYTLDELNAMVAYYTSSAGMSAEKKSGAFRARILPAIQTVIEDSIRAASQPTTP